MTKLSPASFIGVSGNGIISFGSGQPDMPPPKEVFEVLKTFREFKYGMVKGQLDLRTALAKQYPNADPEQFVITNGASEAIDLVLRAIHDNGGKRILLPRPYYYSYPHNVRLAGMEPVYTDLVKGKIDIGDFRHKVKGCAAVLINSPSNPTGTVQEIETLKEIERITQELNIIVISDEVYKDIIYTRENYLIQGPHVVTVNSFSKTFAMCGYRIGYLWTTDAELVKRIVEMKSHTSMNTCILGQAMALAATQSDPRYISEQRKVWKERRDMIVSGLRALGLELWEPEGAFYVLPKIPVKDVERFHKELYEKHKVITYLGEWFGAPGRLRFSYALDTDKILEGMKRLKKCMEEFEE
ncbi:MAG TPA: aminotransferase class I/II-fold pyridoxal phosphate-dependent enzyme [Candidatus Nanoarchaeia archaeon]|nr:aminotransferase class I/II-fold pyridoxal phosphate-dependent enzyme [Candidatus Nanoarchaeia archaeon]